MKTQNQNPPQTTRPASRSSFLNLLSLVLGLGVVAACVTVNVNFPESAVQKATDDYVRDLYRAKEKGKAGSATMPAESPKPTSQLSLIPEAYAFDGTIRLDSAKAQSIKGRQAGRVDEVLNYKRSGILGETSDGQLVIKDSSKVKPLLAKKIEKIVSDENEDRNELYSEALKSNNIPASGLKDMQRTFSRSFQAESPSGTWVQSTEGSWTQKP